MRKFLKYLALMSILTIVFASNVSAQMSSVRQDFMYNDSVATRLQSPAGDYFTIGTGCTTDKGLNSADDLVICGEVEANNTLSADGGIFLPDDISIDFGNTAAAPDAGMVYNTAQTEDTLFLGVSSDSNNLLIAQIGDIAFDFAHTVQINPTLFIHSANQATDEWVSLVHDKTDSWIGTGTGDLILMPAVNVGVGARPAVKFHVTDSTANIGRFTNTAASGAGGGAFVSVESNDGAVNVNNDKLGGYLFTGQKVTAASDGGGIVAYADGNWTDASTPTRIEFEVAPAGSTLRATALTIKQDGDVGIGTSTPNATLEVKGVLPGSVGGFESGHFQVTSENSAEFSNSVITGHNSFGGNTQLWYLGSMSSGNDNIALINRQNGDIHFYTNNTNRMIINTNGAVISFGNTVNTPIADATFLATETVPSTGTIQRVAGNAGAVSLISTPSIADAANDGTCIRFFGTSAANTLTFRDEDNLVNTGLALNGDVDIVLGLGDNFEVCFDLGDDLWRETYRALNIDD